MVSGDPSTSELLDWIQKNTTMLLYDGIRQFRFWPQFRDFLLWELERKYSSQKKNAVLVRGGMYYELKGDYEKALDCYSRGKDHSKVSEILIRKRRESSWNGTLQRDGKILPQFARVRNLRITVTDAGNEYAMCA